MVSLRRVILLFALSVTVALPSGIVNASGVELLISVAASLTDVANEIKPLFEAANPDIKVRYNFGSSGALQQQIGRGAPVDVFVSAAEEPVARLVEQGHVAHESVRHVAANRLVLIARASDSPQALTGWTSLASGAVKTVAIGNPQHVPAGVYARETLEFLGLWESLSSRLIMAEDVRQVLQYVRIGAVDAGVVYATDAAASPDVAIIAEAPAGSHPSIVYPIARVRSSRHPTEADAFVEFLFTQEAREIFANYGFGEVE